MLVDIVHILRSVRDLSNRNLINLLLQPQPPLPLHLLPLHRPLRPLPRIIHRTLTTSKNHEIIQERPNKRPTERPGPWPIEPIRVEKEVTPIPHRKQHQARPKVPARVECRAGLVAECDAERVDREAHDERVHAGSRRGVLVIA